MTRQSDPRRALLAAMLLLAVGGVVGPAALLGQQEPSLPIKDELLLEFAKVHVAVAEAREVFYRGLAQTHDEQGQARLRQSLTESLAAIMEEHEMTAETFEQLTAIVSADPEHRARFEKVLADLGVGVGGGSTDS